MDLTALFACVALAGAAYAGPAIYPHYMDPRRHPDETRRAVKPPDRAQFGNRIQFTSIRHLPDNAAWRDALDTYVVSNRLGNLVWPNLKVLGNGNLPEIVAEIKRRGLWLFDVWGYLPNGKAQGVDGLWRMPSGVCEMLERELGDRWLGMDNGEQDGRWSGSPRPAPGRFAHLLRFQRYFEHMDKTLGNKMAALVSLNYGHYFLRANCYTMLGAETAQALPNGQVYYAFIRGAGKQYGVPWFGNVSVFNRWGWKCYPEKETPGADSGPEKGASLALLKKLLYTQLFYNGLACGFEGSFFHGGFAGTGALSPVGEIQQEAVDWIDRHGDPGVMAVPVGLVIDSARGWCFPRHLYSGWSHVCWGAIPFERSDYFTDGVLDLLYPGYQDSGFFRDERGFNAPTPYGDIADCLLSDAPLWVLKQYALLVLAGAIQPTEEFRDALAAYIAGGGRLVLTEGNRRALFPAGLPAAANGGTVTVIASDWGVAEQPRVRQARYPVETPYVSPYPLTDAARRALDAAFRDAALFTVSPDFRANGLSLVACRRAKGDYTLCIANNTWTEQPLRLTSHVGKILSVEELPTSCRERAARGFAPETATNLVLGADTPETVAAGAVRMLRVRVEETNLRVLAEAAPPPNPKLRTLYLRSNEPIKEQLLRRPTFFRHFDSVMVNWRYVFTRDDEALEAERNWIRLQGLAVLVDFADATDVYPGYRWTDHIAEERARSQKAFAKFLGKCAILGVREVVVAGHSLADMGERAAARASYLRNLGAFARAAGEKGIVVRLRDNVWNLEALPQDLAAVNEPNLKGAHSLSAVMFREKDVVRAVEARDGACWFLGVAEDEKVVPDAFFGCHGRLADARRGDLEAALRALCAKGGRVVFDAVYPDVDAEYRDARLFARAAEGK